MKVFKFGGASVATKERIENVAAILDRYKNEQLLVVVSAIGKTTNALEKVVAAFYESNKDESLRLFEEVKNQHLSVAASLEVEGGALSDFFTEVEWLLHDRPVRSYDYYYDQVVCVGELLSTVIASHYLSQKGIDTAWIDVRDVIRTDNNFRDAQIDWSVTADKVKETVLPLFENARIIITQGFIGATDENESTTLGREGSDYTAAVFANLLNAESQTIWKDVQGVMNADPKQYAGAQWLRALSYREVIEMAYYGAQVIHPKTIKPLQNKGIALLVRSFLHPEAEGTVIHHDQPKNLPPIIVYKERQALLQFTAKDFSFVSEGLASEVLSLFEALKFRPNLTQHAAISLLCVTDDQPEKLEQLALEASQNFDVSVSRDLTLLTIRHYDETILSTLANERKIVLQQQTPETVQVVLLPDAHLAMP